MEQQRKVNGMVTRRTKSRTEDKPHHLRNYKHSTQKAGVGRKDKKTSFNSVFAACRRSP